MNIGINSLTDYDFQGKRVLVRLDINSPIDSNKKIANDNRIKKSLNTLNFLLKNNCKIAIIAHQGDTLDYQNLIPLAEHAEKLTKLLNHSVQYIDDVCGPTAIEKVNNLEPKDIIILGNVRYLCEEISTFENAVKLEASEMLSTYIVRQLAPLFDVYVNDAFAAAHRNCPSMVAFQELLPSVAGTLFFNEIKALSSVVTAPERPLVFVLGGAKISDAFGMLKNVLEDGTADKILTTGLTGQVFLMAAGYDLGEEVTSFIKARSLDEFIAPAKEYLAKFSDKIEMPCDLAYSDGVNRLEISKDKLPMNENFLDIGSETIKKYSEILKSAKTIFVNGPAGVYEDVLFEKGTKEIWNSIADSEGYSVIGGGDTVSAAAKYIDLNDISYVCTAGGAMVRFLSGKKLPLIEAMKKAYKKEF